MDPPAQYTTVAKTLHWIIAALIVGQFALAWSAEDLPLGMQKLALLARHKSVGMTVLMLAAARLIWRLTHRPPTLPAAMKPAERWLAKATHVAFYVLLFAMPLSGWMMSSAKNYSVSWFSLFTWPNLIGPSDDAFVYLKTTHEYMSYALLTLAILHVLAALKHHFWDKDNVLLRMLPFIKSEE